MSKIQVVWFRDLSLWDFKSNGFISSNELFKSKYPLVKISEFLKRNKTQTIIKDEVLYIRVTIMLMYCKEASNRKQEIDRQHYTIPNQRPKDKHCGKI